MAYNPHYLTTIQDELEMIKKDGKKETTWEFNIGVCVLCVCVKVP